jgi:hypothetical protein
MKNAENIEHNEIWLAIPRFLRKLYEHVCPQNNTGNSRIFWDKKEQRAYEEKNGQKTFKNFCPYCGKNSRRHDEKKRRVLK